MANVAAYIQNLPSSIGNGVGTGDNLERGKTLYLNNCTACHGRDGKGNADKVFPKIKGQHFKYLIRQLRWMRDGYRTNINPDMLILLKNMSDQDLQDLADYASRL
jgi:cytochrome c553